MVINADFIDALWYHEVLAYCIAYLLFCSLFYLLLVAWLRPRPAPLWQHAVVVVVFPAFVIIALLAYFFVTRRR